MKPATGLLALVGMLVGGATLHAQVFVGPSGLSIGGSLRAGGLNLGFSATVPSYRVGYYAPFLPYGYGNRTTVVQVYAVPPAIPAVPLPPALPAFNPVGPLMIPPNQPVPWAQAPPRPEPDNPPLPGVPAGGFRPVRPEDRARAQLPPQPEKPKPPEKEKPKAEEPPAKPPDRLPRPPQPEADPKAESARQVALGRQAFANQEYGRAVNRFRLAIAAAPEEPLPHFLLAQTLLAMGKYAEAVDAIHAGMSRRPDWPQEKFQPRELYEPDVALYKDHLLRLEEILAKHPADPILLFLRAHQLWFDGRKDEARALFRRGAPLTKDRTFIDRFLQAGQPIL